jgi:hypothetical protein
MCKDVLLPHRAERRSIRKVLPLTDIIINVLFFSFSACGALASGFLKIESEFAAVL